MRCLGWGRADARPSCFNIIMEYIVGVDEAGRGPLAGPVAVGVVAVQKGFDWTQIPGVRDSKKMTPLQRERVYARLRALSQAGALRYAVSFASAQTIDRIGIVAAVGRALEQALQRLKVAPHVCSVLLDGSLKASAIWKKQKTIIRGDDSEPVISLASIAAKVERDRRMVRLAKKHQEYGFEVHKGYGTAVHIAAIKKHGLSLLHRATFCRGLRQPKKSV